MISQRDGVEQACRRFVPLIMMGIPGKRPLMLEDSNMRVLIPHRQTAPTAHPQGHSRQAQQVLLYLSAAAKTPPAGIQSQEE